MSDAPLPGTRRIRRAARVILLGPDERVLLFRFTPEEALRGATVNAARALGLKDRGTLANGQHADVVVWNARQPAELAYWIGGAPASRVFAGGVELHTQA